MAQIYCIIINVNIYELSTELDKLGIPKDAYLLSGGRPNESFCISLNDDNWEVYYSERGRKTSIKCFNDDNIA